MKQRLFEVGLLLLLAGCGMLPATSPPPEPVPVPEPVCPEPTASSVDDLQALIAHVEDLRKALALGRSSAELAQAAAQVDAIANTAHDTAAPLKAVAALMSSRLAEQRRLQEHVDKLTLQLRDSQRRNEQLNEKLEALKAIEQTLPAKR